MGSKPYGCYDSAKTCVASSTSCPSSGPNNWVYSPNECTGNKPQGCADKRCVATAADCGTCQWDCDFAGACLNVGTQHKTCDLNNSNCGAWSILKTGSCEDAGLCPIGQRHCSDGVCRAECDDSTGDKESLTYLELFSKTPVQIIGSVCFSNSSCKSKEGYNVSCNSGEVIVKRAKEMIADSCDETTRALTLNFPIVAGLTSKIVCSGISKPITNTLVDSLFSLNMGVCVAESTTWYGKLFDSGLLMVYGMGIPAKWVLLSLIGGLLLILVLVFKAFTG
jgi:hypothetical protein